MDKRFDICHYSRVTCFFITFVFCAVSFLTSSAITVDRLIVILLRLKYRHVATSFKGKVIIVVVLWILGILGASRYFWNRLSKAWLWERALWFFFSGHLNYLFHKNFLFSSSKPNSCPKRCFSRTNEPNHSTIPRSLVQKVSVQCILGTVNTGCLLSAFDRSRGIDTSKRASTYIALPCYRICCYFRLFELIIKPAAL